MASGKLISVEEYLALPFSEAGSEYDEGRVIEFPFPSLEHGLVHTNVTLSIGAFIKAAGLDLLICGPTGFWLSLQIERGPDVSLIRRDKLAEMERFQGSLRGAPDAVFEIISWETAADLDRKIDQYLVAGVAEVILIYPELRRVSVCKPTGEMRRLRPGDVLELPESLPGLKLPIDRLFENLAGLQPR